MENIFSQEDDDGKKCLRRHICFKEMFEEDNFSPAPPPPTLPLEKQWSVPKWGPAHPVLKIKRVCGVT